MFAYFPDVRPHWGKSAIVDEWVDTLGANHITALRRLHEKHYPDGGGYAPPAGAAPAGIVGGAAGNDRDAGQGVAERDLVRGVRGVTAP